MGEPKSGWSRALHRLGATFVRQCKAPGVSQDGGGLRYRVYPNGTRLWVVRIVVAGTRRDISVGAFPTISLAEARTRAAAIRGAVARGCDPNAGSRTVRGPLRYSRWTIRTRTYDRHSRIAGKPIGRQRNQALAAKAPDSVTLSRHPLLRRGGAPRPPPRTAPSRRDARGTPISIMTRRSALARPALSVTRDGADRAGDQLHDGRPAARAGVDGPCHALSAFALSILAACMLSFTGVETNR
jgi:Arm DNA-binding domain